MADPQLRIDTWTASDGYVAHCRRYLPAQTPLAHVVCLHGIQSHGGWYEYSCQRICEAGYAVHYLDRRGSGLNTAQRGDTPSFRRLLDDIYEFLGEFRIDMPATPIILCACSWGGKLATAFFRRYPQEADALALICPGFFPQVRPSLGERLRILVSRFFAPRRLFPIPLNDPALFTETPRWRAFIADDPLALHQATARLLVESVRLDWYLRRAPAWITVPVLLQLAEKDRIIHNAPTRAFVESFAAEDKRIIEYAASHHTLEFEPDPNPMIDDLIHWLHLHVPRLVLERQKQLLPQESAQALNPGTC